MIQLVAFDLDGTLMGSDLEISPPVRDAIARTMESGVLVTLATGRMFSAAAPFARSLNLHVPLICYQGGWIQGLETDILHRVTLPDHLARSAIELGRDRGWHTILFADGQLFVDALRRPLRHYEMFLGPDPVVAPELEKVLDTHTPDKVLFVAEPAEIPAVAEDLAAQFGASGDVVQSHASFIEVVPTDVNKGHALAWLAAHMGIPRESVLAVGDQQNDLSMIRWAGTGVAMGNAIDAVREIADWIAPPLNEDGAAVALERFVLREEAA